ncbi:hypothetical protein HLB09_10285 [Pseudokineococcus marinus]|uniref:Lsr2 DNA-binding domain-containing protein n=1 Tax=Pseudokineococcus marinus TaxID=351215 RepID=A0A849BLE0_9ACTN|nr:hypothetical protein [Pseudokineococcus marinus]
MDEADVEAAGEAGDGATDEGGATAAPATDEPGADEPRADELGAEGPATRPRRTDLDDVRAWARENGHEVAARGRVRQAVLDAYDAREGAR